ncbi:nineteen complex-related protein 2-domain-containing protein [Halenospora varia]|nr:nineteen complex-related protein 2-domain-containing protein [Halenospora varia]
MKSAFGSKRKARKIQVDDEDEGGAKEESENNFPVVKPTATNRKGFKKSHLRQSIAFDDLQQDEDESGASSKDGGNTLSTNKPTIGRSNSLMKKKKPASSRLSFGPGEIISGDAAEALEDDEAFTPKKPTLGRRVIEGNTLRKSLPYQSLPVRSGDDDEERPTYSKDYLNELKSSTPTTPKDLQALQATAEDEEGLDASELEGAMIVDMDIDTTAPPHIPTEAEIREKKERRARLAQEKDFISFDEADNDDRRQLSLLPRKKKAESRLVRDDEDIAEGFEEFVDDGRISLGKKAEREAKRKHRKEIADMIYKAEGSSDEESDDSEAERRAAYEAAQTRAGMDGLHKPEDNEEQTATQVPSKITPLPVLSECLERLQATLSSMQYELAKKHKKVADLEKEKGEILARENEVQELLKQAGAKYAALKADTNGAVADPKALVDASLSGQSLPMIIDRGLESFGNTPTVRPAMEDVG